MRRNLKDPLRNPDVARPVMIRLKVIFRHDDNFTRSYRTVSSRINVSMRRQDRWTVIRAAVN